MREFILRLNEGEGLAESFKTYPTLLRPANIPSQPVAGWGSHRILVEGAEISFSDEEFGFQGVFETGDISEQRAQKIMDDIAANIRAKTDATTSIVSI
jgi:hypothetical protein